MRRKSFAVVVGVVVAIGVAVSAGVVFAGRPATTHYVALGDSIAAGQGASVEDRFGYAAVFNQFYRVDHRGPERHDNLAVPGENSSSFFDDQMAGAVEVIEDTDTEVEVVTLTIGSNDLLPLLRSEPCASAPGGPECQGAVGVALAGFAGNYTAILTGLTGALATDPGEGRVLVTTYYNPYDGTGHPFETPVDITLVGVDGTIDCAANAVDPTKVGLNDLIACIGGSFGAETVDVYPLFDGEAPGLTHIGEGDVHPNDAGHRVIADAVVATFTAD